MDSTTCLICKGGCDCEIGTSRGCGHYGCWGTAPTGDCPGAAAEAERVAVALALALH